MLTRLGSGKEIVGVFSLLLLVIGCGSVTATAPDGGSSDAGVNDVAPELAPDVAVDATEAPGSSVGTDARDAAGDAALERAPAVSLVPNGDFSAGMAGWQVDGAQTASVVNGQLCAMVLADKFAFAGWPITGAPGLVFAGGEALKFSFVVSSTVPLTTFIAQVSHSATPFTITFTSDDTARVVVGSLVPIAHSFVVPAPDPSAGLVFQIKAATAGTVCVDNVYLGP
jgi:hypothetical protein